MCKCYIINDIILYFKQLWSKYNKLDDEYDNELDDQNLNKEVHEDVISEYVLIRD
jgi:hypothetical protein